MAGALTLDPALDWAEAALPQQNGEVLAGLTGPVAVVISGPGARTIRLGPLGEPVASIGSGAGEFLRWVTRRGSLEEAGAEVSGDGQQLALVRKLRVFWAVARQGPWWRRFKVTVAGCGPPRRAR